MTADQLKVLEANLWQAADKLRVDSGLKASEYSTPILGLIFLRFASIRYNKVKKEIAAEFEAQKKSRMQQKIEDIAIMKCGFYLPEEAEYDYLKTFRKMQRAMYLARCMNIFWVRLP